MIRARTKSPVLEEGPSCSAALPADRAVNTQLLPFYDTLNDLDGTKKEKLLELAIKEKEKTRETK